jgi:hypothetical protein
MGMGKNGEGFVTRQLPLIETSMVLIKKPMTAKYGHTLT